MSKTLKMCEISDVWGLSRLSYRCQIYFKLRKLTRIGLLQPILLLKRNNNSYSGTHLYQNPIFRQFWPKMAVFF